jgi:hypothetical protein
MVRVILDPIAVRHDGVLLWNQHGPTQCNPVQFPSSTVLLSHTTQLNCSTRLNTCISKHVLVQYSTSDPVEQDEYPLLCAALTATGSSTVTANGCTGFPGPIPGGMAALDMATATGTALFSRAGPNEAFSFHDSIQSTGTGIKLVRGGTDAAGWRGGACMMSFDFMN